MSVHYSFSFLVFVCLLPELGGPPLSPQGFPLGETRDTHITQSTLFRNWNPPRCIFASARQRLLQIRLEFRIHVLLYHFSRWGKGQHGDMRLVCSPAPSPSCRWGNGVTFYADPLFPLYTCRIYCIFILGSCLEISRPPMNVWGRASCVTICDACNVLFQFLLY